MTSLGYAKHSGVMGSFQSLHANREARDPLPIVIVAVDMPLGVYALCRVVQTFSTFCSFFQGMAGSFLEATPPEFRPAMQNTQSTRPVCG